ncbi:hypothetical protein [Kineosporia succinea]|uniref:Uncharacterized protein n=1 Tax=Kineosporia succinea TaxID=84632 RepID=A0ABT9PA58_9ACTN|nr:hypothetical protein [Kineosporia succinea]MDP9829367.1 hypothetical protein [Kineosporia succinea]
MPDLDRTTVILSIHGRHINLMQADLKDVEWRRRMLPGAVKNVIMWRTATPKCPGYLDGWFEVSEQVSGTAEAVKAWCHLHSYWAGLSLAELVEYAGKPEGQVTAIRRGRTTWLQAGQTLGLTRGPQAFQYAPADWRERLEVAW